MLPFATNLPTPRRQTPPPMLTGLGFIPPTLTMQSAVTSPINTSGAASNAAYGGDPAPPSPPIYTPAPLQPVSMLVPDNTIMGLTPLGWGAVLLGAFVAYKAFFAK